tara:strand:+ start:2191 stop:2457 length:267 start_codon:yes stop_codon:yes gene_type:complete
MKFEVKTENDEISKSSFSFVLVVAIISLIIILSNISIKLGTISRSYEINYLCKLLIIEKTSSNFKKLSKLTNQNTKKKMWELCREMVK